MNLEEDFSKKQIALINYLLKRLGFEEGDFLDAYMKHLSHNIGNYSIHKAITPSQYPVDHTKPPKDYHYYHRELEIWLPAYSIVNFLSDEVEMKKRKKVVWREIDTENNQLKISASDISSYLFCPVSYVIKKSIVPEPTINSLLGNKLHNKNILTKKSKKISKDYYIPNDYVHNHTKIKKSKFFENLERKRKKQVIFVLQKLITNHLLNEKSL